MLLRETQVQPLVVIFEDLHWIDRETQSVLDTLVDALPTARLLLLVNYRLEYQHSWSSKTYYRQLRIDILPVASVGEFLAALLGSDPSLDGLKRLLITRTEGNPFFLEESVRSLIETKVLAGDAGGFRLTRPPENLKIPATAQAIIAARIDRLEPEEKRLLQAASVLGRTCRADCSKPSPSCARTGYGRPSRGGRRRSSSTRRGSFPMSSTRSSTPSRTR